MQPGTRHNTKLVEEKPEVRLMSRTEIAAEAEPISWTTPVETTNPESWLKPAAEYGVLIMPFLSLAGEGEGAVYPPVAVRPCQILNGINRKGRRQTHGGVTATSL